MTKHMFCSIFEQFLKQCTLPSTLVFPTLYSSTSSQHLLPWLVSCKPARPPHPWTRPAAGQPEHNFLPFHNFLAPTWHRLQLTTLHFQRFTQVNANNPLPTFLKRVESHAFTLLLRQTRRSEILRAHVFWALWCAHWNGYCALTRRVSGSSYSSSRFNRKAASIMHGSILQNQVGWVEPPHTKIKRLSPDFDHQLKPINP